MSLREFLIAQDIQVDDRKNAYNQIHGAKIFSVTYSHTVYFHIESLKSLFKDPVKLSSKFKETPERTSLFEIKNIISDHINNDNNLDSNIWQNYTFSSECLVITEDFQNSHFFNTSDDIREQDTRTNIDQVNLESLESDQDKHRYQEVDFFINEYLQDFNIYPIQENNDIYDSDFEELNASSESDSQSIKRNYNEMNDNEQTKDEYVNTKKQKIFNNNFSLTLFCDANQQNAIFSECDELVTRNKNTRN